ncbi:MAG TPA: twin-arginine translocation signal domain-containing protein [Xanthobacteraceae bacterium]
MQKNERAKLGRRDILRALGVGAGAAVIAPTLAGEARADTENDAEKRKARYQETDHVKAYYRVNRYPNSK